MIPSIENLSRAPSDAHDAEESVLVERTDQLHEAATAASKSIGEFKNIIDQLRQARKKRKQPTTD